MAILDEIIQEVNDLWKKRKHSCWLFHDWGKWEDVPVIFGSILFNRELQGMGQEKTCFRCNKKVIRDY